MLRKSAGGTPAKVVASLLALALTAATGCVETVRETGLIERSTLRSLLGASKEEVRRRLGAPRYHLKSSVGGDSYFMYTGTSWKFWVTTCERGWNFRVTRCSGIPYDITYCYLLTFDREDVLADYELKSSAVTGITSCPENFWTTDEFQALEEADEGG